jgi:hypothetical protein
MTAIALVPLLVGLLLLLLPTRQHDAPDAGLTRAA